MRGLLLALICILSVCCWGQHNSSDPEVRFQVIHAEGASTKSGRNLNSLDKLYQNDTVVVSENGTVAMIHRKGFPFEISSDTLFSVDQLWQLVETYHQKNSCSFRFPALDLLFISSRSQLREWQNQFGTVTDQNNDLQIFYPPADAVDIRSDVFLYWRQSKKGEYVVEMQNWYGDLLSTHYPLSNELTLSKEDIAKIASDSIILTIQDTDRKMASKQMRLQKFSGDLSFPYSTKIGKPSFALIVALCMEYSQEPYLDGAEKFYSLASNLSGNSFYDQMLRNFKKRRNR